MRENLRPLFRRLAIAAVMSVGLTRWLPAAELFDSRFDQRNPPSVMTQGWTSSSDKGWEPQDRQGILALESADRGAGLTRELTTGDLKIGPEDPLSIIVEYGWRGGRGPGELTVLLASEAGDLQVVMRQDAGEKYRVALVHDGQTKPLGQLDDKTLDAGVQSGGVAESPAVVLMRLDSAGRELTVMRLGGGRVQIPLPAAIKPTALRLTDTSRGKENLRLGRVRAFSGKTDPTRDLAEFSLPFGASFVEGRETPVVRLLGRWFSDEPRTAQLDLTLSELQPIDKPNPRQLTINTPLKPGERVELKSADLDGLAPGLYRLAGDLTIGDIKRPVAARFAVLSKELADRPQAAIPRWVGMVPFINILDHDVYPESFAYMSKIGVRHVRWLPGWGRLEPEENQYNWSESDEFMDLVAKYDMQAMFCLSYFGGEWATERTNGELARSPEGRALWVEKFAVPTIQRYGDRVKLWQIWNEPDAFWHDDPAKATGFATAFGTPSNYYDLVTRTHQAAHALKIDGVRILASLASADIPANTRLLLERGLATQFDGMIIHTYGHHVRHFQNLRKQLMAAGIEKPLLGSGETGLPRSAGDPDSAMRQAQKVMHVLFGSTSIPDLLCVEWFVLHDRVAGGNFGLLNEQYQPHPAATAYATAARLLSGAKQGTIEERGLITVYQVERVSRLPLASVYNAGSPTLATFTVKDGPAPVMWDLLGRPSHPVVKNNQFDVQLTGGVMIEGNVTLQTAIVPVLTTALNAEQKPALKVRVGGDMAGSTAKVSIPELNYDQSESLSAEGDAIFSLPASLAAGRTYPATLALNVRGQTLSQEISVELNPIYRVTAEEAKSLRAPARLPAIPLDTEKQFRPFNKNRTWGGVTDNSATLRLGWTSDEFVLWVEQQDDIQHAIPPQVPNPFGYDSGQWSFQADGQLAPGAPMTEIVFGIMKDGKTLARVLGQPHFKPTIEAEREGTITRYRITLASSQLGVKLEEGVSLGMAVNLNDNDGDGRKGWIHWGQGINGQKNAALHRRVILESAPADGAGGGKQ